MGSSRYTQKYVLLKLIALLYPVIKAFVSGSTPETTSGPDLNQTIVSIKSGEYFSLIYHF